MDTIKQRGHAGNQARLINLQPVARPDARTTRSLTPLATMDDFDGALRRIDAWFAGHVIDRPPVRFAAHNAQYNVSPDDGLPPEQWKARWFDTERVLDDFLRSLESRRFLAETFPVYWPNLGPDVYAAFYGSPLTFAQVTSWSSPIVRSWSDLDNLRLDRNGEYFRKIEDLTCHALALAADRFFVGYTDLHPGMDCALAWRGMEQLCFDLLDEPDQVRLLVQHASRDFTAVFDHFDNLLRSHRQPSVCWMEIPSLHTFHVPSCDFATMMSPPQFAELALPAIAAEIEHTTHNVFHLDGRGVARHIDAILELPRIQAIQWAQGMGEEQPILQWLPLIKKIRAAGKSVIVDLQPHELESFIAEMPPEGILLWIAEPDESCQRQIIKRLERW